MEKPYSGLTAALYLNNVLLGYMNNVSLTLEREVVEVLAFGNQYKEKVPAIKNWSASSDGTVAFTAGGSQHKLYQAYETGELVTLKIALDSSVYFEGQAIIQNLEISGSPDAALTITASFEGNNGVSFSLPETVVVTISSGVGGSTNPAGMIRAAKGVALPITCIPAAGKTANKYYLNGSTSGSAITSNAFSVTPSADMTIYVDWTDA